MKNITKKEEDYQLLLAKFKKYQFPKGYINPYDIDSSFKKENVINPWELWHGYRNKPKIMLIGQDFNSKKQFVDTFNIEWKPDSTDRTLQKLFSQSGIEEIGLPNRKINLPLFFTNAVWAIKDGGKSDPIKGYWNDDQKLIALWKELLEIIEPCNIIAMGEEGYNIICKVYNTKPIKPLKEAIKNNGRHTPSNLFVVYHCSPGSLNRNRSFEDQKKDWIKIKTLLKEC